MVLEGTIKPLMESLKLPRLEERIIQPFQAEVPFNYYMMEVRNGKNKK